MPPEPQANIVTGMTEEGLDAVEKNATTEAINHAIAGLQPDHAFTNAAAATLASLPLQLNDQRNASVEPIAMQLDDLGAGGQPT
jgi:hypothetical protein